MNFNKVAHTTALVYIQHFSIKMEQHFFQGYTMLEYPSRDIPCWNPHPCKCTRDRHNTINSSIETLKETNCSNNITVTHVLSCIVSAELKQLISFSFAFTCPLTNCVKKGKRIAQQSYTNYTIANYTTYFQGGEKT